MIFLTTGEKIRSLRKRFGMRQQELEDENITRAFISMIETGKRGLSKDTARIIAEKLNQKAKDKGNELNIDEDYLLRTPAEDAEIYCLQKLVNIPTQDEIEVILEISKRFQLIKVEAEAYKILGDIYYKAENLVEAFINYMLALDLYKDTEYRDSLAYIFNRLGLCKLKQDECKEASTFFYRAFYYAEANKDEAEGKISLYNHANCCEKLNETSLALKYIDKYLSSYSAELSEEFVNISILKARCYYKNGTREAAFAVLLVLLDSIEEGNILKGVVCRNLGELYKLEGNIEKSLEYFTTAEELVTGKDKKELVVTLIAKAAIYIKQTRNEEALKLLSKAMKLSSEYNMFESIVGSYYLQIEIYKITSDFNGLKNAYIKLIELLKNEDGYKAEAAKLYNKLALLYLEQNDIEMCKKYLNMVS